MDCQPPTARQFWLVERHVSSTVSRMCPRDASNAGDHRSRASRSLIGHGGKYAGVYAYSGHPRVLPSSMPFIVDEAAVKIRAKGHLPRRAHHISS